tara:strand:+ start:8053 stop:9960 length:1908 start_codon:yes stop_codon:yes gene_type:complete
MKRRKDNERENYGKDYIIIALLILIVGFLLIRPVITGQVVVTEEKSYVDSLNLLINDNYEFEWVPEQEGKVSSVRINGRVNGVTKVYLREGEDDYLIFDSSQEEGLLGVTGFVGLNETLVEQITETVVNESVDKSIKLKLNYYAESEFDVHNDGVEASEGVVDLNVGAEVNFDAGDKLCTRWSVDSGESVDYVCYGNDECCGFLDLESSSLNWNDTYYSYLGKEGAGYDNVVSAQVVYVDYNISELEAEIVYSEVLSLPVKFLSPYTEFEDVCVETCLLPGLNASSYVLVFEVENGSIEVDSISYTVKGERIVNSAPELVKDISDIVGNYTINLSKYFFDEDGDVLEYSYYKAEGISVEINKDIAVISGDVRSRSMFFIANDSEFVAVSNVFKVNVEEAEAEVITVKPKVVIGRPVKWVKRVKLGKDVDKIDVTKGAFNISVKDVAANVEIDKSKIKVKEDNRIKDLDEYESEKKGNRKERNLITGAVIGLTSSEEQNVTEIIIEETVEEVEVEYYTEGPTAEEFEIDEHRKRIVVSSDIHYEDILSYTELPIEAKENAVKLYWLVNGSKQEVNIDKFDTNSNGLIDYIEWIVPSLSNQTYELEITILNVQSYPTVGGEWEVRFETTGVGNKSYY